VKDVSSGGFAELKPVPSGKWEHLGREEKGDEEKKRTVLYLISAKTQTTNWHEMLCHITWCG